MKIKLLENNIIQELSEESINERLELKQKFEEYVISNISEASGRIKNIDPKPNKQDIIKAIENREYVGIYYEDKDEDGKTQKGFRLIEPYAYGIGFRTEDKITKKDVEYLRAYVIFDTSKDPQLAKQFKIKFKSISKSKKKPEWRMLRVDRIQNWRPTGKVFSNYRKQYNPDDKKMGKIIKSLPLNSFPKGVKK
jgi:hypothetical protein